MISIAWFFKPTTFSKNAGNNERSAIAWFISSPKFPNASIIGAKATWTDNIWFTTSTIVWPLTEIHALTSRNCSFKAFDKASYCSFWLITQLYNSSNAAVYASNFALESELFFPW